MNRRVESPVRAGCWDLFLIRMPLQAGDVPLPYADIPSKTLEGVRKTSKHDFPDLPIAH